MSTVKINKEKALETIDYVKNLTLEAVGGSRQAFERLADQYEYLKEYLEKLESDTNSNSFIFYVKFSFMYEFVRLVDTFRLGETFRVDYDKFYHNNYANDTYCGRFIKHRFKDLDGSYIRIELVPTFESNLSEEKRREKEERYKAFIEAVTAYSKLKERNIILG